MPKIILRLTTASLMLRKLGSYPRQSGLAVDVLKEKGEIIDDSLLQYLSPLGWEHINLTGDYVWKKSSKLKDGKFRPLRVVKFS